MPVGRHACHHVWAHDLALLGARYGTRPAVTDLDETVSFATLTARAFALAARLAECGARPGERVATLIRNSAEAVHASWAIAATGACEVTLNPAQSVDEQTWCLDVTTPRVLLHDGRAATLPSTRAEILPSWTAGVAPDGWQPPEAPAPASPRADWARILFTSGTTGRPKGVVHTHAGRWLAALLLRQGLAARLTDGATLLLTPFSHGSSLLAYALLPAGLPVRLVPGFEPDVVAPLIRSGAVAHVFAPPAVLVRLVELFHGERIDSIRTLLTGTAPLPAALYAEARSIFGPCVRVTYGMTEIFNPITVLEPVETDACFRMLGEGAVGMVGWPAAGVEISVRDEKGRALPAGAEGEIFVHAEHMYEGYLRDTDTFEPAPRFHATGDLGRFDPVHGLRLLGRLHDVIKTGGYKVHPQEVETALRERGASGDLVVLGLPSERWGEVVVLARAQPEGGSFADLQTCAAALTAYKRPRIFVAVPAIRRNAIGKVDRRAIRDDILNRYELVDGPHPELRSCNA